EHSAAMRGGGLDVGDGSCRTRRNLEMPFEHLLEKITTAPRAPTFELGIISCAYAQHNKVRADLGANVVNRTAPAPVKTVSDAQERGELPHALAIVFAQCGVASL